MKAEYLSGHKRRKHIRILPMPGWDVVELVLGVAMSRLLVSSAYATVLMLPPSPRRERRAPRCKAAALLFSAVPRENLIEDDGAEGCGANPSHREVAEL